MLRSQKEIKVGVDCFSDGADDVESRHDASGKETRQAKTIDEKYG